MQKAVDLFKGPSISVCIGNGASQMYNIKNLPEACYRMATNGGYVLAFSKRVAADMPELTWEQFRNVLLANGHGFCGYAEVVVKKSFEAKGW